MWPPFVRYYDRAADRCTVVPDLSREVREVLSRVLVSRHLSRSAALGVLGWAVLVALSGCEGHVSAVPEEVAAFVESVDPERPWPVFVAAENAVTASGEIVDDLFYIGAANAIRVGLEQPERDGCVPWGEAYHFDVVRPELDSIAALVEGSDPIFRGIVLGSRPGFFHGLPGRLLKVEIVERLKGESKAPYTYLFYPVGRFTVGGVELCKTDVRHARVRGPGEEILVFGQGFREEVAEPFLHLPDNGAGLLVLSSGDDDRFPRLLREANAGRSGTEILEEVRVRLEATGGR